MRDPSEELSLSFSGGWLVLSGELTLFTTPSVDAALSAQGPLAPVRLDLSGVYFIDSAGILLLVKWRKSRGLTLRGTTGQPLRVLGISGLLEFLGIETDKEGA